MIYILAAILIFGVLIAVHELGHFLAAKACGVRVNEFAIGMGPALFKKTRGDTTYALRLLPIGGYCQFYGEDEEKNDPRAFNNQPVWKRAITVFSGPLMNFVIAFLVIALFMSVIGVNAVVPKVAQVEETAQAAGLQIGDEITAVNGETIDGQGHFGFGRRGGNAHCEAGRPDARFDADPILRRAGRALSRGLLVRAGARSGIRF